MAGFEKTRKSSSKITGIRPVEEGVNKDQTLKAIIKVDSSGYVPKGVSLRERVSSHMFTADVKQSKLEELEGDDKVKSVAISKSLDIID